MSAGDESRRDRLEALFARWEDERAKGRALRVEELCREAPELADELRSQIAELEAMDWLDETHSAPLDCCGATTGGRPLAEKFDRSVPLELSGRYRIESLIAEGGFGQVWRATDKTLERPVAIKLTTRPCIDEARRVAGLKHQGIISVHDTGNQDGFCFIVFDLVEGIDLAERIRRGRLPWREAVDIVARVAEYLHYAHQKGFVHRDIKPANILLGNDGIPVLADFGIAVTQSELEGERSTTIGTMAYMAPEQLVGEGRYDGRVDIYGMGVVLYELLTGQTPFQGATLSELRTRILTSEPRPIRSFDPQLPERLEEICRKCLRKSPLERYSTAEDVARELHALGAKRSD